jgi:EAL domain-containing protein (putative c-di-GMP-specific phosphodiesterase class I)
MICSLLYKLEPIVALDTLQIEWAELLLGSQRPFPQSLGEWREWYRLLPRCVEDAVCRCAVPLSINVDTDHILDGMAISALDEMRGVPLYVEWTERRGQATCRADMIRAGEMLADHCQVNSHRLVLDDMGAGEDIMTRLIAVSETNNMIVKMDGELFQDGRRSSKVGSLLKSYVDFFQNSQMDVCVEWIETEDDLQLARSLGARWGQGYLWKGAI